MKLKDLFEGTENNILFQNEYGYIQGKLKNDGIWWIDKFYIYPEFRGKGYARKLAEHIPEKAMLLAQPLFFKDQKNLDKNSLINFYKSLGFEEFPDDKGNIIMKRGII